MSLQHLVKEWLRLDPVRHICFYPVPTQIQRRILLELERENEKRDSITMGHSKHRGIGETDEVPDRMVLSRA